MANRTVYRTNNNLKYYKPTGVIVTTKLLKDNKRYVITHIKTQVSSFFPHSVENS